MWYENMIEGADFYFEDGRMVLTAEFLLKRGRCCKGGCRHCPYGFKMDNFGEDDAKNTKNCLKDSIDK